MYVRFNLGASGRIYLQQLLSLDHLDGKDASPVWENVPLTGLGLSSSVDMPVGMSCGLFMIEEKINKGDKIVTKMNMISALSISNFSEADENKTRIETLNKKEHYILNISLIEFLQLLTSMLCKFKIVTIDSNGNITTT